MTLVSLSPDDIPPDVTDSNDIPPLRCEQEGCHNTLTYAGRGRRPKFCEEHKKSSTGTGTGKSGRSAGWAKGDAVEKNLTTALNWAAAGITFVNPKDGKVIAKGGPAVAHELVEIARVDKRYRPYLEWIAAPGKYGPLALATLSVVLPIMANHGLLPQFIIPILEMESGTAEGGEKA